MKKMVSVLVVMSMLLTALGGAALAESPMTITWLGGNPPLTDGTWGEQAFEEAFGVDVVIVRADSAEQQSVLFASGEVPDYMSLNDITEVGDRADQGILRTITLEQIQTYMPNYYAMCTKYDPNFFNYGIVNNEIYAVPRFNAIGSATIGAAIRADWLKATGHKVPKTVAELEEVFKAFTLNDPDGNGANDTYGLTTGDRTGARYIFQSIFGIFGVNPFFWTVNGEGELQFGLTTPQAKEGVKLLRKWYEMGLIDPEFITTDARSSGTDVTSKFASGKVGYMDVVSFDDYQWDNDGHVSAKWVANHEEWQKFFTDNADNPAELYKYAVASDFSDDFAGPYYINLPPVSGPDGQPGTYLMEGNVSAFFGFGINTSDEKVEKLLAILDQSCMDEETYMLHYGPEGLQWMYDEGGARVFNPQYTELPEYHPQGQVIGSGWCLFPMFFANPEYLTVISGDRNAQRYEKTMPLFTTYKGNSNALTVSLPSSSEYSEIMSTFVRNAVVKAITGSGDVEAQWDAAVKDWYAQGGEVLTKEANEWWKTVQ